MPCRTDYDDRPSEDIELIRASLCMLLKMHGLPVYSVHAAEYAEAGIKPRELENWWKKHQEEDKERRAKEARKRKRDETRKRALAKLTPYERTVLLMDGSDDSDED